MNAHTAHPHTAAAVKALEAAQAMEDELLQVRAINRTIFQLGTFIDVVIDSDDQSAFMALTQVVDGALDRLEGMRSAIVHSCHSAKHGVGKLIA